MAQWHHNRFIIHSSVGPGTDMARAHMSGLILLEAPYRDGKLPLPPGFEHYAARWEAERKETERVTALQKQQEEAAQKQREEAAQKQREAAQKQREEEAAQQREEAAQKQREAAQKRQTVMAWLICALVAALLSWVLSGRMPPLRHLIAAGQTPLLLPPS